MRKSLIFVTITTVIWSGAAYLIADQITAARVSRILASEIQKADVQSQSLAANIQQNLDVYRGVAKMVASIPVVSRALSPGADRPSARYFKTGPETAIITVNNYLTKVNPQLGTDILWLANPHGKVVASNDPSLIGQDFSSRPYSRAALTGELEMVHAFGHLTMRQGFYFSAPVRLYGREELIGAAVVKVDVSRLSHWLDTVTGLIVDNNGVVLASHAGMYDMFAIEGAKVNGLSREMRLAKYGRDSFPRLPLTSAGLPRYPRLRLLGESREPVVLDIEPIAGSDLSLVVLSSARYVLDLHREIFWLFPLIAVLGMLLLAALFNGLRVIQSDRRFRAIFYNTGVGIALLDRAGRFVEVNSELERILGVSSVDLRGHPEAEYVFEDDRAGHYGHDGVSKQERRYFNRSGEVVSTRFSCRPFHYLGVGRVHHGYLAVIEDITQQKAAEELAAQQQAQMISASKMSELGVMASGLAHEVNNPLAVIMAKANQIADHILAESVDRPFILAAARKIHQTGERIAKIIRGLRTFSRNAAADPFRPSDPQEIVEDTLSLCRERIQSRGIELRIRRDNDGQPFSTFDCRASEISQVLLNLLSNAADAVARHEHPWIELELRETSDLIRFTVTDSGTGIPEAIAGRMMEPFFTTKEVGHGTGLGLSISRGIIDSHRGRLWLDHSNANTRFVVDLPKRQGAHGALLPIDRNEAIAAHVNWKQKLTRYLQRPDGSLVPEEVASEAHCVLGKWIHARQEKGAENPALFVLAEQHAKFHRCAAEIVRRANSGEELLDQVVLGADSEYNRVSDALIATLLENKLA